MKESGFSAVEMLVTLAILAIVLAIAAPSFKTFTASSNMISNTNGVIGAFNYARMEAVKRGGVVRLGQLNGNWTDGIVVWVDNDGDGLRGAGEELRLWPAFDSGSTAVSVNNRSGFSFRAIGDVNHDDILTICDSRTGEKGMQISVLLSGAIIAKKVSCA